MISLPVRQFAMIQAGDSGQRGISMPSGYDLYVNDLDYNSAEHNDVTVWLIGDAFDSSGDELGPEALAALLVSHRSAKEAIEASKHIAGRWLAVYHSEEEHRIWSDPCGLMQVFICDDNTLTAISSSLSWLSRHTHSSPTKLSELTDSCTFLRDRLQDDGWLTDTTLRNSHWPLRTTPFEEIIKLDALHSISIIDTTILRYWPNRQRKVRSVRDVAEEVESRLTSIMKCIGNRYGNINIPVTRGLDSTSLLYAALNSEIDFTPYTYSRPSRTDKVILWGQQHIADIEWGIKVASAMNMKHECIWLEHNINELDLHAMFKNTDHIVTSQTLPFEYLTLSRVWDSDVVCINGNVSEIGRLYYGASRPSLVSGKLLQSISPTADTALVRTLYERWSDAAKRVATSLGYDMFDLFYLEERMGGWLAYFQSQMQPCVRVISPFNCLSIIESLLSVPALYRSVSKVNKSIVKSLLPLGCPQSLIGQVTHIGMSKWARSCIKASPILNMSRLLIS